jgi:segregation and condensation protein A
LRVLIACFVSLYNAVSWILGVLCPHVGKMGRGRALPEPTYGIRAPATHQSQQRFSATLDGAAATRQSMGGDMAAAERNTRGRARPDARAEGADAGQPRPTPAYTQPQLIPYTVHLPGFDGPLDLLLHLIERNQLEITAISLVAVTDQFVTYLKMWDEPPLPRLAEFVTMAARLLLIKSRSLLPRHSRQDDEDGADPLDDAEQLRRHLIEYKLAREIARALRARELAGLQSFARPGRLVDPEAMLAWSPPKLVGLNVNALAMIFRRVLLEKRFAEPEELPLPVVTIAEKIAEVEALLAERGRLDFAEALATASSRLVVVVTFLAILELWHQRRVLVEQEQLFGPITILPGPRWGQSMDEDGGELRDESYEPDADSDVPMERAHTCQASAPRADQT